MEIKYENLKDKLADALYDIITYDTPRNRRINFIQLNITVRMMHDVFGIFTRSQAIELRQMITEAKKNRIKK